MPVVPSREPGGFMSKSKKLWLVLVVVSVGVAMAVIVPCLRGGEVPSSSHYQVLDPIRHGNLTIFPVVTSSSHDTHAFLTLDEGLRSGGVVVSESGSISPLVRPHRRDGVLREPQGDGAQV